jgi:hypothetical protein
MPKRELLVKNAWAFCFLRQYCSQLKMTWPFRAIFAGHLLLSCFAASLLGAAPSPADRAGIEFFEQKIRAVLVEHCYKCHSASAEKIKGGLLLDTQDGVLKGGDSGPAIIPGDPEKSLLIKAVRYLDENLQMPPKNKKLSAEHIANLEAWVKMGAPDPRTAAAAPANGPPLSDPVKVRTHWAFQPITLPAIPKVKNQRWVQTPIDAFVLAKLEAREMQPSRAADRRTLIRRATFDLTGLPPNEQETEDFVADKSPQAFARVVDRLLASPQYGERWGRHWLDVARYADTKGYVFEEERRYPYAYTYRDYVIRAFNEDLPFDRFVIEQLAADQLDLGADKRPLAALGFLTLGRRFLNNQPDIIDDRIDVMSRGLMGLTVTCARCHDHKYDPIPTRDYYSLYGVFASCNEPADKPLLGATAQPAAYSEYVAERKKREEAWTSFRRTKEAESLSQLRQRAGDYLLTAFEGQRSGDSSKTEALARERKLDPNVVQRWIRALENWGKQHHSVFAPWFALAALPTNQFSAAAKDLAAQFASNHDPDKPVNPLVARMFAGEAPASMKQVAERYGKLLAGIDHEWQEAQDAQAKSAAESQLQPAPLSALADPDKESLRQVLFGPDAPANIPSGEISRLFDVPTGQKVRELKRKLDEVDVTHPGAPPRAMVLADNSTPVKPHVFIRGNPNNPGPEVPRQFLEVLSGENRQPFKHGSGRLELAQSIAGPANPLTARVLVNRVWLHHFGVGIVRTPSDFGLRAEPPSHPELLDYLAWQFRQNGWSVKQLHQWIMLSSVYQQSSDDNPRYAQVDPNNFLLWRMNRRRLEFEPMRDTLLAVSGKIDLTAGGRPVDITAQPSPPRRTLYGFVERQNLPGLFRTFDFASPDSTSPQRFFTTVPQQALFMLNSPFLIDLARQMVDRPELRQAKGDAARIQQLYQLAYQRAPDSDEMKLALEFLQSQPTTPPLPAEAPAWLYGYGEYDEAAAQITQFHEFKHFTGSAWQAGGKLPDDKLGWVMVNADGGHPGEGLQRVAIRRWIAPRDGVVGISGDLTHDVEPGDGVRGRLVSSRAGRLGEWIAHKNKIETRVQQVEVKRGDWIDFVVDCRVGVESDAFHWVAVVTMAKAAYDAPGDLRTIWNSKQDFSGPKEEPKALNVWEKFAQALLMSNELAFVD